MKLVSEEGPKSPFFLFLFSFCLIRIYIFFVLFKKKNTSERKSLDTVKMYTN